MRLRGLVSFLAAAACLLVSGTASAARPHASARVILLACLNRVAGLTIGPVRSNTPEVPRMNQLVQPVWNRCSDNDRLSSLAASHPHDEALQDAYRAHFQLGLGVGDYMTYLTNVAFGHGHFDPVPG